MSCPPASYAAALHTTPALATGPVQALLELFADHLPWLSDRYGLVQTATRTNPGKKPERVPQIYRQDGTLHHFDVLPAQTMRAMCFFERTGPSLMSWDEGAMQLAGSWRHPLELVVWCNLPKIDPDATQDFSDALARDVWRVLVEAGIPVTGIEQRAEEVFRRYTLDDKKLLMCPYAGFKIPLTLTERYTPCVTPLILPAV